jgi:Rod binding domain-containing protein
MSTISGLSSSGFSSFGVGGAAMLPSAAALASGRGPKAAREFEAQLIGTVLQSLEKTFATVPGEDAMAGEDDYNYLGTQALASAVAAGGGFGIARLIAQHLGGTKVAPGGVISVAPEAVPGG